MKKEKTLNVINETLEERKRERERMGRTMEGGGERERERVWKRDLLPNFKFARTRVYKKKSQDNTVNPVFGLVWF